MALPQTRVPGRQEVRARRDVAVEEPGDGDPDRRERRAGRRRRPSRRRSAAARAPAAAASVVSPRWAARKARLASAKPNARVSSASERIAIAASSCRSAVAASARTRPSGRWRGGLRRRRRRRRGRRASSRACLAGGDRVVEPVGEVELDGEGLEQVGLSCGVVADVRQGELVEGDGLPVRARHGRPRLPLRPRSAGSAGRRARPTAWWASTLASPPIRSSASIIVTCRAGSEPARPRRARPSVRSRGGTPRRGRCGRAARWPRALRPCAAGTPRRASNAPLTAVRERRTSSSSVPRLRWSEPAVRATTASRTLSGSGESGWARIWLTKNGLPAVRAVDVGGVEAVSVEQLGDGRPAQRGELQATRVRRGDQVAEHRAQRDGRRRSCRGRTAPSAAAASSMRRATKRTRSSGRLVGPVQVLDDEDAGSGPQRVQHRGEDLVLGRRVRAGSR